MSSPRSAISLISPAELDRFLKTKDSGTRTLPVDVTLFLPDEKRSASEEYAAKRIPGAVFFDIAKNAGEHPLGAPLMLPSPEKFARVCSDLGIARGDHVVFYDQKGLWSAPRGAWMFTVGSINADFRCLFTRVPFQGLWASACFCVEWGTTKMGSRGILS